MTPAVICNRAIGQAGAGQEHFIGDIEEGTEAANLCLVHYMPVIEQLLRAAHWDFARKLAPLTMLGDRTGNTDNVGSLVMPPWTYEYAYPIDCMKARFVPVNGISQSLQPSTPSGNISLPTTPQTTGGDPPLNSARLIPARFLVSTDFNYPVPAGTQWWTQQGTGPDQRTVVLTNVNQASLVYTARMVYPNMWDSLFQAAVVAMLAAEIALPLAKDKRFGMQMRAQAIAVAKERVAEARIANGNEGWQQADISVDWMRARNSGAWGNAWGWGGGLAGPGVLGYGWDSVGFGDAAAY